MPEDHVINFYAKVDFSKIRTNNDIPELIFLCGGTNTESKEGFLRPKLHRELGNQDKNVVLAESAMNWENGQKFAKDLLELERYFAALVSVIPLVCESFGSVAELGAFVADENIKNKLFIIIEEKYYSGNESKSFIRNGPIKNFENHFKKNYIKQLYVIGDGGSLSDDDIKLICKSIVDCKPSTTGNVDFSKEYFQILLLIDLINILVLSTEEEIIRNLKKIIEPQKEKYKDIINNIPEMLFVLETLKLVKKRTRGAETYFLVIKNYFYLTGYGTKIENISNLRTQILYELYSSKNSSKSSILKEEEKKADEKDGIEWLRKKNTFDKNETSALIKSAPFQYKTYTILKKNGKLRTISQPTPRLKQLQRLRVDEMEKKFAIHHAAKAYIKGENGILQNATFHKESKFFYKFDFKDFFSSIKARDFNLYLAENGYTLIERLDLIRIFFRFNKDIDKEKLNRAYRELYHQENPDSLLKFLTEGNFVSYFELSIGAPGSPFLSNILMYDFDKKVSEWANKNEFKYTRFADDLTFSSDNKKDIRFIQDEINKIIKLLKYPKLELNNSKQKYCSFKSRVNITGLVITSDHKISIGQDRKKEIRAKIHHFQNDRLSPEEIQSLQGWLAYVKDVEPLFFESMIRKYSNELINNITAFTNYSYNNSF